MIVLIGAVNPYLFTIKILKPDWQSAQVIKKPN